MLSLVPPLTGSWLCSYMFPEMGACWVWSVVMDKLGVGELEEKMNGEPQHEH